MKIISPFRDYYDTAGGVSQSTIWTRKIHTYQLAYKELPNRMPHPKSMSATTIVNGREDSLQGRGYILFCGEVFPFRKREYYCPEAKAYQIQFFYGEELEASMQTDKKPVFLSSKAAKKEAEDFYGLTGRKFPEWNVRFDSPVLAVVTGERGWSSLHDTQSFEAGRKESNHLYVLANPNLQEFDFQKVVDPYQARQRIEQFLNNELTKESPMPETSDKSRMAKHGMDKWSFRNPDPPKRKQK